MQSYEHKCQGTTSVLVLVECYCDHLQKVDAIASDLISCRICLRDNVSLFVKPEQYEHVYNKHPFKVM